jgi:tripartite-type tricarboxylate transporter receptor subunit TctC
MRVPQSVLAIALLSAVPACSRDATSREWPSRPVTVIVPFGAGGGADLVARLLVPRLSERWRQPVIVDNRPGADGIVGAQAFVSARDEHTLLFTPAGLVTLTPLMREGMPFDPAHELVPTAAVVTASIAIGVTGGFKASSLADLMASVRSEGRRFLWAAAPGLPEVIFKAFLAVEKLEMTHVPYRDGSMAVRDLAAGRVHVGIFALPTLMPQIQSGAVRLLAVTSTARVLAAPDVPTSAEAGYPGLSSDGRWGFYGWRNISPALRDRIAADVRQALEDKTLCARLVAMGLTIAPGDAEEFGQAIERQRNQVREIARILGFTPPTEARQ